MTKSESRDPQHEQARLAAELGERQKELAALHETARIMHNERLAPAELLTSVVTRLPTAFQSPERTVARITYGAIDVRSQGYTSGPWRMSLDFATRDGRRGELAVVYLDASEESPFLIEERSLLQSITDMLEITLERRLAHDRLELAVASTGLGVWEWDLTSQRIVWSSELERMAGLAPDSFDGTQAGFLALVHPDDAPTLAFEFGRASEQGHGRTPQGDEDSALRRPRDEFSVEYRFVHANGNIRWVLSRSRLFRHADGRALRWLGTVIDISDRRRLEEELRHSQKMDAIGRLAGGIAHDFSNLLQVIMSNTEFLATDLRDDANTLERLSEIRSAAQSAADLTRQIMSFNRKNLLQPLAVDPVVFLDRLVPLLRRLVGTEVTLHTDVAEDVGLIRVDAGHLEQVLMNVIANARDAMPVGGTVKVDVRNIELDAEPLANHFDVKPGPYVVFKVVDTGMGMNFETMARVFEPFFTTKAPTRGTGLGLATVFGIVRQSGGHIAVDSVLGRGSTFTIYLPRAALTATPTSYGVGRLA